MFSPVLPPPCPAPPSRFLHFHNHPPASSVKHCTALNLDGVVVIGGDDSNTNAALLAEYFKANGATTKVIGAPKTIDGDLKNEYIPVSFGFDTACKTYSELIGNVLTDALSTQKYYHFVRLMGRSATHITLECALQTQPNMALIGEEVQAENQSLSQIVMQIADMITDRSEQLGKDYGCLLVPEGLIEFIPEMGVLIGEINEVLAKHTGLTYQTVSKHLSEASAQCFACVPYQIQQQLMLDRDSHGNVQVSNIETEKLLSGAVATELEKRRAAGAYGGTFSVQYHFYGYEGRSGLPSGFDCNYCYTLGWTAATLVSLEVAYITTNDCQMPRPADSQAGSAYFLTREGSTPRCAALHRTRQHSASTAASLLFWSTCSHLAPPPTSDPPIYLRPRFALDRPTGQLRCSSPASWHRCVTSPRR